MGKKLLFIPVVLYPYLVLLSALLFFGGERFFKIPMDAGMISAFFIFVLSPSVVFWATIAILILCTKKRFRPGEMSKWVMIIKLVQIPAYIGVFVMGLFCFITIFTVAFSFLFFWADCFSILMTGVLGLSSIILDVKDKRAPLTAKTVILAILQFVFCADVVAAVIHYIEIKKAGQSQTGQTVTLRP